MDAAPVKSLPFSSMSDDEVKACLREYAIGLTVEEARTVETLLGRAPTVVEAVIWGIQGSEHCSYKSSRRFLSMFHTSGRHVILGPGEDSGIVAVSDTPKGKRWGIVVSHESHNKPSQVVPFEGAATGVGGTVRDVACMGARVIGCMDMLRLGDLKTPESRGIAREVIRGIAGYGNPLGVPNLGGDTFFDAGFNAQCLVNAIAIGIVREDEIIHSTVPDEAAKEKYDIIIVGKPTDRSGFGGAAFASVSLAEEKKEQNAGAVQEPNPFLERHLLVSTYALFDWLVEKNLLSKVSFKDLGAGGVVCASVEQVAGKGFGAEISLDNVHVSLPDLPAEVIACAETQERFCWVCHPSLTSDILRHYNDTWDLPSVAEGARASVIGHVTADGIYRLSYKGAIVCEATSKDITSGLRYTRPTAQYKYAGKEPEILCEGKTIKLGSYSTTLSAVFRAMLAHPNHASKQTVIRGYDKTVIGNSIIEAGEADASVIQPFQSLHSYLPGTEHPGWDEDPVLARIGIAFAGDGNPRYGRVSPYLQGANATVEAICNIAAVGASPRALTDCLNYANPEVPEQLGALEDGVRGIADAATALAIDGEPVPVISGNVSLYNGAAGGKPVPPSAVVCAIGVVPDASIAIGQTFKKSGSSIFLIGERKNECGASAYYEVLEQMSHAERDSLLGSAVPVPDYPAILHRLSFLQEAIRTKQLLCAHDISDGGMLLALFEMTVKQRRTGGDIGCTIDLAHVKSSLRVDQILFSQSQGFLLEVDASAEKQIEALLQKHSVDYWIIGKTTSEATLRITDGKSELLSESLKDLQALWCTSLENALRGA